LNDGYLGSGRILLRSIKKYGKSVHTFEILEYLSDTLALTNREKEIVNLEVLKNPFCMNLKVGGNGGGGLWNDIHKQKFLIAGHNAAAKVAKYRLKEYMKDPIWKQMWLNSMKESMPRFLKAGQLAATSEKAKSKRKDTFKKIHFQQGEKNSNFGKMWINNNIMNKQILKTDIMPEGFVKGRKMSLYASVV
jgi:hypothetical protein